MCTSTSRSVEPHTHWATTTTTTITTTPESTSTTYYDHAVIVCIVATMGKTSKVERSRIHRTSMLHIWTICTTCKNIICQSNYVQTQVIIIWYVLYYRCYVYVLYLYIPPGCQLTCICPSGRDPAFGASADVGLGCFTINRLNGPFLLKMRPIYDVAWCGRISHDTKKERVADLVVAILSKMVGLIRIF